MFRLSQTSLFVERDLGTFAHISTAVSLSLSEDGDDEDDDGASDEVRLLHESPTELVDWLSELGYGMGYIDHHM